MSTEENSAALLASKFINNTNRHIFLTGKAGTGKTTFLRHIIKQTHKNAIIAAPTGIAAINAGGVTIHSLLQLPFGAFIPGRLNDYSFNNIQVNDRNSLMRGLHLGANKRKLIQELELLIIDEVSMLRADLLDAIDTVLRSLRRQHDIPFGGIQLLFIGDLLQLPPVVKDAEWSVLKNYYKSAYFFDCHALRQNKPLYIELEKIYRQADNTFINILNNLRNNSVTKSDIEILNSFYKPGYQPNLNDERIHLTTHNSKADSINKSALMQLSGKSFYFKASVEDDFSEYSYPVEEILELKLGAQIMFIKNDPTGAQRFFNGKIGRIADLNENKIEVLFNDTNTRVSVDKYEWQNVKFTVDPLTNEIEEKVAGTFTQYPIKLAWAITIHKSQGLTFSKALVDIGGAFAPGQVYVALSRLTSLDGLILTSPIEFSRLSSETAVTEFNNIKLTQEPLDKTFEKERHIFLNHFIPRCFDFRELHGLLKSHLESFSKDENKSQKQKHFDWTKELHKDFEVLKMVSDKFLKEISYLLHQSVPDIIKLNERVIAAKKYFTPILKDNSKHILKQIDKINEEKKVKTYLAELVEIEAAFFKQMQLLSKAEALLNSALSNTELTKESITPEAYDRFEKSIPAKAVSPERKKKSKKIASEKIVKENTKEISYNLYKQNKSISEIALERSFAITTIEGHLAYYVSLGMLDVKDFVQKSKLEKIVKAIKSLNTDKLTLLKETLGPDYSYTEIKFATAYCKNANIAEPAGK